MIFISLRSYGGKKRTFCPHFCQHLPITSTFRTVTGTSNCGPRWTNHLETGWSSKKTKCFTPMKNFLISKIGNKRKIVHFRSNFRLKNKLQQRLSYKLLYYFKKTRLDCSDTCDKIEIKMMERSRLRVWS